MFKNKYVVFCIVLVIFVFPVVTGSLLYHFHHLFKFKTLNHGVLLSTPVDVKFLYADTQKKWRIIYVDDGVCNEQCKKLDFLLHQVQKALGKNQNRVEVLQLNRNLPSVNRLQGLLAQPVGNKIYLVDPLGNLFMYYLATDDPVNVLKDLKKVLEVSQIG